MYQTERTKLGEIAYRKKEALEELAHPELIWPRTDGKIQETIRAFERLDLKLSPKSIVGEIGAGRCQRILGLIDRYGLERAYAFDISPDVLNLSMLVSLHYFRTEPHERLDLISGDFLQVQFRPKSFDVLYCFATLHHFPDPKPVLAIAHRLLKPGGYFYFDHEPLQSKLGLHEVIRWVRGRGRVKERDWGILETQFPLQKWQDAWNIFERAEIKISFPPFSGRHEIRSWHEITGGRLSGVLRKQ